MSKWLLLVKQHHVGGTQQKFREQQPPLLPAAEGDDLAWIVLVAEAEAAEHFGNLVVELVGALRPQQLIEPVETLRQLLPCYFIGRFGEFVRDCFELSLRGEQFVERRLRFFKERAARGELFDLLQHAEPRSRMKLGAAMLRLVLATDAAQQRGLAGAVRPDQADAVPGMDLKRDLLEERCRIEATYEIGN